MSNKKAHEWESALWGEGLSSLDVAAIIVDLKNNEKKEDQMKRGLEKAQMLECQNCHEWFFINEMFSVDACTEEHQKQLLEGNEVTK